MLLITCTLHIQGVCWAEIKEYCIVLYSATRVGGEIPEKNIIKNGIRYITILCIPTNMRIVQVNTIIIYKANKSL